MRKPKNRKERIDFIVNKMGINVAQGMLYMSDKEVKQFVDSVYLNLKNKEDHIEEGSTCIRCGEQIIHHTECGCGNDRSIFSEEEWKYDIESFSDESDRCPEDEEFIKNGYKLNA
ncbi:hypothetical protein AB2T82_21085 [Clostridium butyricum]|uniref:hypothetical protein n=1 Tax=Clostridium butyricum TaxID=1492 RepID=UPI003466944F